MGTWGHGLYDDDFALDIRESYIKHLQNGIDKHLAIDKIFKEYEGEKFDINEASVFWLVIADTQWDYGMLEDTVKQKAFFYIDSGIALSSYEATSTSCVDDRRKTLLELKSKLIDKQPKNKKNNELKYRCKWKIGDVYAYPILSDYAKEKGLHGKYFLFYKVAESFYDQDHIVPVVWVKLTRDDTLPQNADEFNDLEYVQTSVEDEDRPFYHHYVENQRSSSKTFEQKRDEFGELPIYRIALINTSKRAIPKELVRIGNFENIDPPELDNLPICDIEMPSFVWKFFEKNLIDRYFGLNLRQGSRYDNYRK